MAYNLKMAPTGIYCISKLFKSILDSRLLCHSISRASSSGESFKRLKAFFENEKETVQQINEQFALPYVDVQELHHSMHQMLDSRDSTSLIMKSSYNGQLHRPAIPMKYILSHVDEVQRNVINRKSPGLTIDVQKQIVEPYQRIRMIQLEKDKSLSKKESLGKSVKDFWINHGTDSELPPDIAQIRTEVISLSCKIKLLSWIQHRMETMFYEKALLMPSRTFPESPVRDESYAKVMEDIGTKPENDVSLGHMDVGEGSSTIRQSNLANISGLRTYYLRKGGAELEQALVRYTLSTLQDRGFRIMSCPNILHGSVFEGCGIPSSQLPEMLYRIDPNQLDDFFISGASEVALAGYFANHAVPVEQLPLKICCVSTCNRKETDTARDSQGLYRVNHYTKIEMFGLTANETGTESEELFQEFLQIQKELFSGLGLHFRIRDVPTKELPLPAYQKVNMEAWMSHRKMYGEISSTSNCADFQSRRLHILYKAGNKYRFAHIVNGTACAVPRVLMCIYENNQNERSVQIPKVLTTSMHVNNIDLKSMFAMEYIGPNQSNKKQKTPDSRDSTSLLMRLSFNGQLHRPSIPMNYILSHVDDVQRNVIIRKASGLSIDVQKDIVEPYQRMEMIQLEMDKSLSKKESLEKSVKDFWINHRTESELPPDIAEMRNEEIALSNKISLLSWMRHRIEIMFYEKALLLPNRTHPESPVGDELCAKIMKVIGAKPDNDASLGHMDVGEMSSTIRQSNLANISGLRTYYLSNEGAELEQALVQYAMNTLQDRGFHVMSCPNILHGSVFEGCGIPSSKLPEMLYRIDPNQLDDFYISGTSEVALAGYFANHAIPVEHLPLKICCVSTCNRKETDTAMESRGLYRVHHFTKVEMFGVTANETGTESEELFHEFLQIQEDLFSRLGLHFRILNMPTEELALPAYQKVDMEAWMSHRKTYGEISSTSNCTDFQSRRLHIMYKAGDKYKFAHTVNGTACAVPRVLIAIYENNQIRKSVQIPKVLTKHMRGKNINKKSRKTDYIGPNQSKKKQRTPID